MPVNVRRTAFFNHYNQTKDQFPILTQLTICLNSVLLFINNIAITIYILHMIFFTSLTMIPTVIISLYEKINANATNLLTATHLNLVKLHLVYYHINFLNTVTIKKVLLKCLRVTLLCIFEHSLKSSVFHIVWKE